MTPEDRRPFLELLAGVHSFYRADLTDFAADVWQQAMQPYTLAAVRKAFTAHATDPKAGAFLPKPADLVRVMDGTYEDRALLAWGKVFEAMQRVGQYADVVFDDPAIHAAIADMGGWPKLCACTLDELPHIQRRLTDLHAAYTRKASTGVAPGYPKVLPGVASIANNASGHQSAPPVLIGDQAAALRVLRDGSESTRVPMHQLAAPPMQPAVASIAMRRT